MLINLKLALRYLWKNKLFSTINIFGLSLGLSCCTIILLHVKSELSYDRFHTKKDRILRVLNGEFPYTPEVMASRLLEYFPEIESVIRVAKWDFDPIYVKQDEKLAEERDLVYADSGFFDVFSFPILVGDPAKVLQNQNQILISEKISKKYFNGENPVGKLISLRIYYKIFDFTVEGVFRDFPVPSHFHANFVIPMKFYEKQYGDSNWGSNSLHTYILTKRPGMMNQIAKKMPAFIERYVPKDFVQGLSYSLQPLVRIHLFSEDLKMDIEPRGSITRVIIFSSIAILVLIIAIVNFVLLSIALSFQRIKEFGIRKVVGALRKDLISLVTTEFIIIFILALLIAFMFIEFTIPFLEVKLNIKFQEGIFSNLILLMAFLAIVLLIGYAAGVYLANHVSRIKPMNAIRNSLSLGEKPLTSRSALVVFQFTIMIALIVCLMVMQKQIHLLHTKNLGFHKEQLLVIDIPQNSYRKYLQLKDELVSIPSVLIISGAAYIPPRDNLWTKTFKNPVNGDEQQYEYLATDYGFIETMGIELLQGRSFSREFSQDSISAILINESAVKLSGLKEPVESELVYNNPSTARLIIIGVIKDFHIRSLYEKVWPLVIYLNLSKVHQMVLRIAPFTVDKTISLIREKWQLVFPDDPMQYTFVDEGMRLKYIKEEQVQSMIRLFCLLSLIIALFGLFGLSVFSTQQRTKEIGIRKANGASAFDIFIMLSIQFGRWIIAAFVIASPVAWYAMHRWLEHFAYRTEISWWIFAMAGFASLSIAFITICWQTYIAATRNPVEALRYE